MNSISIQGRARKFGGNINTDYIISSSRKRETLDPAELKKYLMEGVDPKFAASVKPGDVIVAGKNFGCGSAMEVAATVILGAGIGAVLAESFSRTFFRNAINNGLVPIQCDTGTINEGDRLAIDVGKGIVTIRNLSTCVRESIAFRLPEIMLQILEKGGVVPYLREYRTFARRPA